MEILGIGPLELGFAVLIALILLGPKDMVKAIQTVAKWMRDIVTSQAWQTLKNTSHELRYLPNRMMKEAGLAELDRERMASESASIGGSSDTWKTHQPPPPIIAPESSVSVTGQSAAKSSPAAKKTSKKRPQ